jgi:hypothetical protein
LDSCNVKGGTRGGGGGRANAFEAGANMCVYFAVIPPFCGTRMKYDYEI